jgi:peptide-methionine (R)-S-oxide reductase
MKADLAVSVTSTKPGESDECGWMYPARVTMFESESSEDRQSKKTTRRMFLGSGIAVAAGVAYLSLRRMPDVEASGAGRGTPGMVTIVNFSDDGKNLGKETVPKIVKSNAEWKAQLPGNSYDIARLADTEMAFTGSTWNEHSPGIFRCICCDTALFDAKTKFESGTGWPSFRDSGGLSLRRFSPWRWKLLSA